MQNTFDTIRSNPLDYNKNHLKTLGTLIIMDYEREIQDISLSSLNQNIITFGRNDTNDIRLVSQIVSSKHGEIQIINNRCFLMDIGSTNGTYLNGVKIEKNHSEEITDGSIIRIDSDNLKNPHDKGVLMIYTTYQNKGEWKEVNLHNKKKIKIGRFNDNDIVLNHSGVSKYHAVVEKKRDNNYYISDNNSTNGIMINGKFLNNEKLLEEKDTVLITNSILIFTSKKILYRTENKGIELKVTNLSKHVYEIKKEDGKSLMPRRQKKQLLQKVSLSINPNEFVAIIGGSGTGKSTLLNAMCKYEEPTSGNVYINGSDLYKNYSALKSLIGYVPQQDIIYENLKLIKMLRYTAELRMPEDTSEEEREKRISEVLDMVGLKEYQEKYIRKLSGGQKKRASIAVEMLADPSLFFLDEPTSGLDPGTEKNLMEELQKLVKEKGKTVVVVTHTTLNLHLCDKIIFMGKEGRLLFCGTFEEAKEHFQTSNLVDAYNKIEQDFDRWHNLHIRNTKQAFVSDELAFRQETKNHKKNSSVRQFGILCSRYVELILNDKIRSAIMLLQPLVFAILLSIVKMANTFSVYEPTRAMLFCLSCCGIWIGIFNSIQEICKERVILKREYMATLKLSTYIASKVFIQGIICFIQAFILISFFILFIGKPDKGFIIGSSYAEYFVVMFLTIYASSSIGLVISAKSKNSDRAMTVAPILLILQLLFSGIIFPLDGFSEYISYITVSRWSVESLGILTDLNSLKLKIQDQIPTFIHEAEKIYERTTSHILATVGVLISFIVIFSIISILLLKNISKDGR